MRNLKISDLWQSATMLVVLWSFIMANLGNVNAAHLWENGAEGIAILLGLGVGMKFAQRTSERYIDKRYGNSDIGTIGEP